MTSSTPVAPPIAPVGQAAKISRRKKAGTTRENAAGSLMALPAMLGIIAFVAVPFVAAIVLSFYRTGLGSVRPPRFVGFTQYVRLFTDPVISGPFLRSLVNNLTFAVVVIPVQIVLALLLAVLLNRKLKGVPFFRTFFFMPVVFPMALVAVIWRLILDRGPNGLLNSTIHTISGGTVPAHDWLGSPYTAMLSVIVLSIWQGVGFQMVIILAALQEIPEERYEAARLDRANAWQQFINVTVPGIRNTLIFVIMLTTILAFRVYDQVFILIHTAGANREATQTVLFQATAAVYDDNDIGRASAISVVLFIIIVAITLIQRVLLRQRSEG
ncbi:MAG TPA: sugar ABC transporter permease [Microlunatus sp.]|nr:sugar ABC transporter permease [Microlunatus sp.]